MRSEAFLPPLLLAYDREKPWKEWLAGSVLFADVSGFTPMSEALSVLGAEGGEVLTDVLNRYFTAMIGIVHDHGGQVMKFGGDAILCFFPGRDSLPGALRAARLMQDGMGRFQHIKTPVKRFALKMKIGVAHGECLLAGVGDPAVRCDYVFAGAPVDATSDAEHHAVAGEIVFAGGADRLSDAGCRHEEIESGFFRVSMAGTEDLPLVATESKSICGTRMVKQCDPRWEAIAAPYLIREVHDMVAAGLAGQVGALLDIVPVFLKFAGFAYARESFDLARFDAFFRSVMKVTEGHGGRLNRISMGDKGSTFFILFGAPKALEKKEELACQWALDLKAVMADFPEVTGGIGLNAGRVFAGIVGGAGRAEYTVMGDAVNFAARLMQGAQEGQVCLSGTVRERTRAHYDFDDLGARRFKGKAEPLSVFSLAGRGGERREGGHFERLVGRSREQELIRGRLKEAAEGKPGMAIIEGEPGTGKSFLADHILKEAEDSGWRIVKGHGEITRRNHPYAPWTEVLAQMLFQGRPATLEALERSLDEETRPYLQWHAELFGISLPTECNAPLHDEETRKRLFQHQLSRLILSRVSRTSSESEGDLPTLNPRLSTDAGRPQPVCIFLDDLHWFDTLSIELLGAVLNHFSHQPVFILSATRLNWEKMIFQGRSACLFCPLADLDREGIAELSCSVLGGKVRESLGDMILEKTRGNPFYTRQYLLFLKQEDLLESRLGEWLMKRGVEEKADLSASDILATQVSRLSPQEQVLLKFAACIGPTLSLPILRRSMGVRFRKTALNGLLTSGYLLAQDSGVSSIPTPKTELQTLSFPHALIQEALYSSIPQRERRRAHGKIALVIEALPGDSLKNYYPNLANHFLLAGKSQKALEYSTLAAEQLAQSLSYPEASRFWEIAYRCLHNFSTDQKIIIGLQWSNVLLRSGQLSKALDLALKLQKIARKKCQTHFLLETQVIKFNALDRMGQYSYIKEATRIANSLDQIPVNIRARVMHQLAVAYWRNCKLDLALRTFENIAQLGLETDNEDVLSSIVFCAGIAAKRMDYKKAMALVDNGLKLAEKGHKLYQQLRLIIEKCDVLVQSGYWEEAKSILKSQIDRAEAIGDYYLLSVVMMNLGYIAINQHNWDEADAYLQESMNAFASIGVRNGRAKALMNRGIVSFYRRRLNEAYQYYYEATMALEETKEVIETCHGYYNLAEVCLELGRLDEAKKWYQIGSRSVDLKDYPQVYREFKELQLRIASSC